MDNMTFKELQEHYKIRRRADECKSILQEMSVLAQNSSDRLLHGEAVTEALAGLQGELIHLDRRIEADTPRVVKTLKLMDDACVETICSLHYQIGYDWKTVAKIVNRSEESVKSAAYRGLRKAGIF